MFVPGSRRRVLQRLISRRPWRGIEPGIVLRVDRAKVRITGIEHAVVRRGDDVEHVTSIATCAVRRRPRKRPPSNVVKMPFGDATPVADFLRYHVLVRVFDGDVDAWIARLTDEADVRFARGLRTRMRRDPSFLDSVRMMVDAMPLPQALVRSR